MKCSFCSGNLKIGEPVDNSPAYRCTKCNVRIVVTNQSYMPDGYKRHYWRIVNNKLIGKQEQHQMDLLENTIHFAGINFTVDQIKSAVITIDGRDISIGEKSQTKQKPGFVT